MTIEKATMRYEMDDGTPVARLEWTGPPMTGSWKLLAESGGADFVAAVIAAIPSVVEEMAGLKGRSPDGTVLAPMVGYYGVVFALRLIVQRYGADQADEEIPDAWITGEPGHRY